MNLQPDYSFRSRQLDYCLEGGHDFLTYWIQAGERSLPERMKNCRSVKKLVLIGRDATVIEDISLIEELSNVESFSIQNITTVKDLSPILRLPNLQQLRIEGTPITNEIIAQLPLLDELHFVEGNNSMLIDCELLTKQVALKKLSLCGTEFLNEECLKELSQLKALALRRHLPVQGSKTLDFLTQFPGLEHLSINVLIYSGYSNVDAILKLEHLKSLHVQGYEYDYEDPDWLTIDFLNQLSLEELHLEESYLADEENIEERLAGISAVEITRRNT